MCQSTSRRGISGCCSKLSWGALDTHFAPNELGFLALTSKVERPICDRLAFSLSTRVKDSCLVAREWSPSRVDLAVLFREAPHSPRMLLEVKAWYTFNLVGRTVDRVVGDAKDDRTKLLGLAGLPSAAQLFVLVVATHPLSVIGPDLAQVAKYWPAPSRAITRMGSANEVGRRANDNLAPKLRELGAVHAGTIEAGEAYGVPLQLRYWLVGPIDRTQSNVAPAPGRPEVQACSLGGMTDRLGPANATGSRLGDTSERLTAACA